MQEKSMVCVKMSEMYGSRYHQFGIKEHMIGFNAITNILEDYRQIRISTTDAINKLKIWVM